MFISAFQDKDRNDFPISRNLGEIHYSRDSLVHGYNFIEKANDWVLLSNAANTFSWRVKKKSYILLINKTKNTKHTALHEKLTIFQ